ncbi:uncharacterized protein LOC135814877 [Sycon ciliatum]|uniref:uncharacterized protein LOC135814877 n=1 Tax=Sycon ciliatum TaxID=27933 RepID=UPI0031F6CCEC
MDEQVKDTFFGELRSLARRVEKGRQELQDSLEADTESTEQLDNLRTILTDASTLKTNCVNDLSAANSTHAEHNQALTACRSTLERCRQGLESAISFLEQYGYDRGSLNEPTPSSPPTTVACPTTPTPDVSNVERVQDTAAAADNSTPTLERAGISAHTLATLRRGNQAHQARTHAAEIASMPSSVAPSAVAPRTRPPIHHTPNSDDLDRMVAQLNIESVHVLGPMQRTGLASAATHQHHGATMTSMAGFSGMPMSDSLGDNTMHIIGNSGASDPYQTPLSQHPRYTGASMSSAFTNQSQQPSHHQMPGHLVSAGIPYNGAASVQPTPAQPSQINSAFTPGQTMDSSMMHAYSAAPGLDPETPRPSTVQHSRESYADPASYYTTPSTSSSAFNTASRHCHSSAAATQAQTATAGASATDPSAFGIAMPDIQSVSVLPPGARASTAAVAHSTDAGMGDADRTLTSFTTATGHVDLAVDTPQPSGSAGMSQIRTVTEGEYLSMPEYLRYQLTYQLICDVVMAINHLTRHPRGDVPAGHFTVNELRSMPNVGSKAQCTYLVLSKLSRIQSAPGYVEQTFTVI